MTQSTIDSELDEILNRLQHSGGGSYSNNRRYIRQAKTAITNLIAQEANKAVYGFHEYIMGKDIIRPETDQAFNYARLHRALDDYIASLTADKEQAE